ncbi:hypothetical protein ABB26_13070 [Stenotrophomonas humi]|uniref:DUF11 domain-containing protein n=2 Tax=Stenotrophomonas humi TaxID=405444 RepID=A0A0R0CBA2_9GAMM|nr:hypothetical protein ABB26_13070 [Stenotrophomonas humi]
MEQNGRQGSSRLARFVRRASLLVLSLLPVTALATVVPQNVNLPPNMGEGIDTPLTISWLRTAADAGQTSISVVLPPSVDFVPPASPGAMDCTYATASNTVTCPIAPGNTVNAPSGSVGFSIRARQLGSFNLTATSSTSPTPATGTTTVRETGNLQVTKRLISPDNGQGATGGTATFEVDPQIAAGGSNLPAGAKIEVTDQLPNDAANVVTSITPTPGGGNPVCETVAKANSSRSFTCVYTGPMTAAQFNAAKITVVMRTNGLGTHTNNASIATVNDNYFDADPNDNSGSASYNIVLGTDIEALVSFPSQPLEVNTAQNLVLTYKNNGPQTSTVGGTVSTIIPDGFVIGTLPVGCSLEAGKQLTVSGTSYTGTLVTCDAGVVASGGSKPFTIPLTMPPTGTDGRFPVVATPPAALKDWNEANNSVLAPYQINEPYTDIGLTKTKNPSSGPVSPGAPITSSFSVSNGMNSTSAASYTPAQPLYVVDYMRPQEMDAGYGVNGLANVTPGWECTVQRNVTPPNGISAAFTTQVTCKTTGTGSIARGGSLPLSFQTRATAISGQLNLSNRACTGITALGQLGVNPADAAQPADRVNTNDCATAGGGLNLTDVIDNTAWVNIRKESSVDQISWHDPVADAPTLSGAAETVYWKILVSTPSTTDKPNQKTIPTLNLTDDVPGVLNTAAFKGRVRVLSAAAISGSAASVSCPALPLGARSQTCVFSQVTPGTEIEVVLAADRPLQSTSGNTVLTNTATLTSPNAVLSSLRADGLYSDSAAVKVLPRTDYRMTSKTVTPSGTVLIGEPIAFTLTARNHGPDAAPQNDFHITDALPTGTATMAGATYEIIDVTVPSGSMLDCSASNKATGAISCVNSRGAIAAQTTETVTISARVKKPANLQVAAGGVVYPSVTNQASVASLGAVCQWLPGSSTSCDDAASNSNNSADVTFEVRVPTIDLQQKKTQVYPNGRSKFVMGDQLRYRLSAFNLGPSQAENVEVRDRITAPAGFTATFDRIENVNTRPAVSGYAYKPDTDVSCTQQGAELVCVLNSVQALNRLDKEHMVEFEVLFTVTGDSSLPVLFNNIAYVCGDETTNYESQGKCSFDPNDAGNNLEQVNDVIFPSADLEVVSKTTVTPGPVNVGQPIRYDIVVRNAQGSRVEKMRVIDTLPAGFEWVHDDTSHPLTVKVDSGSGAVLSGTGEVKVQVGKPPVGADNYCYLSAGPPEITNLNQQQAVTCDLGGSFPSGAANTLTLTLWVRTVPGVFTGGYVPAIHTNKAAIEPGRDADDEPTSMDLNPNNNEKTSTTQVRDARLGGLVFSDDNDNGDVDGGDTGIANVDVTLTGTDLYGNPVSITVKTNNDGEYQFINLAPSNAAGYTITQTQPAGYVANGTPQPNTARPNRNDASTNVSGTYTTTNTATTSVIGGVVLGGGGVGVQFDFPEPLERKLSGYVYIDQDNNHVLSSADARIGGATVYLDEVETGRTLTATTDNDQNPGFYEFTGLTAGRTYVLREPLPTMPTGLQNLPAAVNPGKIGSVLCGPVCLVSTTGSEDKIAGIKLVAGNGTEFNFGENITTAISGKVYLDRDDSGLQNGTEPGIPGVTITVTDSTGTVVWTGPTAADGSYTVPGLIAGHDYTITETQPGGLKDGQENNSNVITITKLPPTGSSGNNFGELAASLAGRVYLDQANDGHTATDPGLGNVQVTLSRRDGQPVVDVLGNTVSVLNTVADGSYAFIDLPAGDYIVTQQVAQPVYTPVGGTPVTTLNGTTTAGTVIDGVAGVASTVRDTPSAITGVVLNAGGKSVNNNFGEILPVSASGVVFFDLNNNGVQEPGDAGIGGVDIRLVGTDDQGNPVDTTVPTNADGSFSFDGLRPGTYTLIEPTQPVGTAQGKTTAGQLDSTKTGSGTASNGAAPESSKIANIDLSKPGDTSTDNLFAEVPTNSGITGKVWLDANNDGVVDPGEVGIAGVEMELTGSDINGNPITPITVTTGADGSYSFLNLPPGEYKVVEKQQPADTNDGKTKPGNIGGTPVGNGSVEGSATAQNPSFIGTITVGVGQVSVENNFGEVPAASISGNVYNDSNDDGIRQPEEGGFANVTVELTGTDDLGNPVTLTTTTDANGKYSFDNLRPGTYVVTEPNQPAETLNGKTTAGSTGGTGSNPSTTTSEITGIVLKPGDKSVDNNFGEIGDSPDMLVSKSSTTVKFTVNNVATYTIRVRNGGQQASKGEYLVKDRLPVGLNLAQVPSGNGWTCSGAVGDTRFECRSSEVLNAGVTSTSDITVKVNVTAEAAQAGTVNNAVLVEGGGENEFRTPTTTERAAFDGDVSTLPVCDTAITQNVCRVPNQVQLSASVGGTVWFDIGSEDTRLDGGDERLQSWIVELLDSATGLVSQSTITAADGSYRFGDVIPGIKWNLQFRDPASGVLWAWPVNQETAGGMGVACDGPRAISDSSVSACRITENGTSQLQVVLEAGQHLPQQSLPVDPSGVVYDAVTRDPVPGSIVTITPVGVCNGYDPMTAILNAAAGGYRVEGNAVSMTVGNNGYYQFMFGPAAPARCEFQLTVTPPGGYQFVSSLIAPQEGSLSPLGAAGSSHLVQPQSNAPTGAVGTPTQYWLTLFAGSSTAGIVHNHLPLDTAEATGLVITKTGDRQTAEIGDTVQYTITVRQTAGSAMATLNIVDTLPRGFTYIDGTARVGGRALEEPFGKPGPRLGFNLGPINVGQQLVLTYRVRVGVGAQQGDGINRAQAHGCSITGGCIDPGSMTPVPGSVPSNRAEYRVRVTGGVFTEEACVLGKVFVDCNNNHLQDNEELGIPGVRLYFSNGTWVISDSEGKYSYCGLTPQSHTLKVDPSTLPAGSRLTTSSNRNLGDADSLFLDLKNGELHRADFIEGSCSNPLLEQVKARRTQGEVRAPETETGQSQLRFESKPARAPQQATDSANQRPIVHPRPNPPSASASQEVQP